jgi:hypothetical protein
MHGFRGNCSRGFILPIITAAAFAARGDQIFVSENGTGYVVTGAAQVYFTNELSGTMMPDPSGGIHGRPVLVFDTYSFPDNVPHTGDVALVDVNNGGTITHLLRFYTDFGFGYLIFYANDGSHSLADVGLPTWSNAVQLNNQGPAGTSWNPQQGQPGCCGGPSTQPVGSPQGYVFFSQFPASAGSVTGLLTIATSPSGVTLSWPAALTNYSLYASSNLATGNWAAITNAPTTTNTSKQVTLPPTSNVQVFRLQGQQ